MKTVYGSTHGLPPRPFPGSIGSVKVIQLHLRAPRLYAVGCWLGLAHLAYRLLAWESGYR